MLYFKSHSIQNTSVSAIYNETVFYSNNGIFSYSLSSGESREMLPIKSASSVGILDDSTLYVLSGNNLTFLSTHGYPNRKDLRLCEIPTRCIEYQKQVGFLYATGIEICKNKRSPVKIETGFKIKDMAVWDEECYILTESGRVLRCRNMFITEQLNIQGSMVIPKIEKRESAYERIFAYKDNIFLMSSAVVEKYKIENNTLVLLYRFAYTGSYKDAFMHQDYLATDSLVHLSKAPFLVLKDRLFCFNGKVGVAADRIYFLEETRQAIEERPLYESRKFESTVNRSAIKVPEFVKDAVQKEKFINNSAIVMQYEKIAEEIRSLCKSLEKREMECAKELGEIRDKITDLERKGDMIRRRVAEIKIRADKVAFKGNAKDFYEKITLLDSLLKSVKPERLENVKEMLKAQNAILKEKAIFN